MDTKNYSAFSVDDFEKLFFSKLHYYHVDCADKTSLSSRMFYFEGQDAFAFNPPCKAMSELFYTLSTQEARENFVKAIWVIFSKTAQDVLLRKIRNEIIWLIGLVHQVHLLIPIAEIVTKLDPEQEGFCEACNICIMVFKGAQHHWQGVDAYEIMKAGTHFPYQGKLEGVQDFYFNPGECSLSFMRSASLLVLVTYP